MRRARARVRRYRPALESALAGLAMAGGFFGACLILAALAK